MTEKQAEMLVSTPMDNTLDLSLPFIITATPGQVQTTDEVVTPQGKGIPVPEVSNNKATVDAKAASTSDSYDGEYSDTQDT